MPDHIQIPNENRERVFQNYTGSGPLDFPYAWFEKSDINVWVNDEKIPQENFSVVSSSTLIGGFQGGQITLVNDVTDAKVVISLDVLPGRTSDFGVAGARPQAVNSALDRIHATLVDQRIRVGRSLQLRPGDDVQDFFIPGPEDRNNTILAFSDDGNQLEFVSRVNVDTVAGIAGSVVNVSGISNQIQLVSQPESLVAIREVGVPEVIDRLNVVGADLLDPQSGINAVAADLNLGVNGLLGTIGAQVADPNSLLSQVLPNAQEASQARDVAIQNAEASQAALDQITLALPVVNSAVQAAQDGSALATQAASSASADAQSASQAADQSETDRLAAQSARDQATQAATASTNAATQTANDVLLTTASRDVVVAAQQNVQNLSTQTSEIFDDVDRLFLTQEYSDENELQLALENGTETAVPGLTRGVVNGRSVRILTVSPITTESVASAESVDEVDQRIDAAIEADPISQFMNLIEDAKNEFASTVSPAEFSIEGNGLRDGGDISGPLAATLEEIENRGLLEVVAPTPLIGGIINIPQGVYTCSNVVSRDYRSPSRGIVLTVNGNGSTIIVDPANYIGDVNGFLHIDYEGSASIIKFVNFQYEIKTTGQATDSLVRIRNHSGFAGHRVRGLTVDNISTYVNGTNIAWGPGSFFDFRGSRNPLLQGLNIRASNRGDRVTIDGSALILDKCIDLSGSSNIVLNGVLAQYAKTIIDLTGVTGSIEGTGVNTSFGIDGISASGSILFTVNLAASSSRALRNPIRYNGNNLSVTHRDVTTFVDGNAGNPDTPACINIINAVGYYASNCTYRARNDSRSVGYSVASAASTVTSHPKTVANSSFDTFVDASISAGPGVTVLYPNFGSSINPIFRGGVSVNIPGNQIGGFNNVIFYNGADIFDGMKATTSVGDHGLPTDVPFYLGELTTGEFAAYLTDEDRTNDTNRIDVEPVTGVDMVISAVSSATLITAQGLQEGGGSSANIDTSNLATQSELMSGLADQLSIEDTTDIGRQMVSAPNVAAVRGLLEIQEPSNDPVVTNVLYADDYSELLDLSPDNDTKEINLLQYSTAIDGVGGGVFKRVNGNGFYGLATITDGGSGYTNTDGNNGHEVELTRHPDDVTGGANPPRVRVYVEGGEVVFIRWLSAGSGLTQAPIFPWGLLPGGGTPGNITFILADGGCYVRLNNGQLWARRDFLETGVINPEYYGARGNASFDDAPAWNKSFDFQRTSLFSNSQAHNEIHAMSGARYRLEGSVNATRFRGNKHSVRFNGSRVLFRHTGLAGFDISGSRDLSWYDLDMSANFSSPTVRFGIFASVSGPPSDNDGNAPWNEFHNVKANGVYRSAVVYNAGAELMIFNEGSLENQLGQTGLPSAGATGNTIIIDPISALNFQSDFAPPTNPVPNSWTPQSQVKINNTRLISYNGAGVLATGVTNGLDLENAYIVARNSYAVELRQRSGVTGQPQAHTRLKIRGRIEPRPASGPNPVLGHLHLNTTQGPVSVHGLSIEDYGFDASVSAITKSGSNAGIIRGADIRIDSATSGGGLLATGGVDFWGDINCTLSNSELGNLTGFSALRGRITSRTPRSQFQFPVGFYAFMLETGDLPEEVRS